MPGLGVNREIDSPGRAEYAGIVKNNSKPKRVATPEEVVRLAKKMKWHDIEFPGGEVVTAATIREMFDYAEAGLKAKPHRKAAHAPVS